jgi:serine/threonine-protein kinase SRPK3
VNTALSKQARQVQIFDSQPLASPSTSSSWSSRSLLHSMAKLTVPSANASAIVSANGSLSSSPLANTKLKSVDTDLDMHAKRESGDSDLSDASSGPSSIAISCSVIASVDTPPSSVGSLAGALDRLVMKPIGMKGKGKEKAAGMGGTSQVEKEIQEATCTCIFGSEQDMDGNEHDMSKNRVHAPSGPSLLSQTAPPNLHRHRPQCSTHSAMPADADSRASVPAPASTDCLSPPTMSLSPVSSASSPTPSASAPAPPISIKIADLGNATPLRRHYTEDIQTRQYRAPEAITGRSDWGATADMWSAACVVFELLTAEYLFDPQSQGELFGKDDDHCAQIVELLGPWPESVLWGGRYSREIFDSNGECRVCFCLVWHFLVSECVIARFVLLAVPCSVGAKGLPLVPS